MIKNALVSLLVAGTALIASPALTQQDPIKRMQLQRIDFPGNNSTILMAIEVAPNALVPRHTHPGVEVGYVLEGEAELIMDGMFALHLKAGDSFQIPAGVPHSIKNGGKLSKTISTFVVDKDKPLASAVP